MWMKIGNKIVQKVQDGSKTQPNANALKGQSNIAKGKASLRASPFADMGWWLWVKIGNKIVQKVKMVQNPTKRQRPEGAA